MARMPVSANIKLLLVLLASGIVIGVLFYTHSIVEKLQAREKKIADLYANGIRYLGREESTTGDISFIFDEIIKNIDFPIILTGPHDELLSSKNIDMPSRLPVADSIRFLTARIGEMRRKNPPIMIMYRDSIVLNYFYYDESELVRKLRWLPYVEIIVAGMFIFIGYIGFSYIRRSEQSNVWVGMSKETAHQLGTPLSSMLGWIELLKTQVHDTARLPETVQEMENDVQRLNKIAMRFSKIGSMPDLKEEDLVALAERVIVYFRKRLPQTNKRVELEMIASGPVRARVNAELFEWVLENLVKNGIDAIENNVGKITITLSTPGGAVCVDVTDTGKGIDRRYKKDVFRPGYSTKKRGWGLGLSLSKRIIETYHKGRLTILESAVGKGATFRIRIDT